MCGRYALYGPSSRLREQFGVEPELWAERYNIAPSQQAPVIREETAGKRIVVDARWGLLPSWAKEPEKLAHPINAKLETAAEKPMFRHALRHSRVLIPASGFFEWKPGPDHKQPYFIVPADGGLFGLGGLLEHWEGPEGTLFTYTILTTAANDLMAPIHDRMPVIVAPQDYAACLDPSLTDPNLVREIASDLPSEQMRAYPVGRAVGNPRSQGPQLVAPIETS